MLSFLHSALNWLVDRDTLDSRFWTSTSDHNPSRFRLINSGRCSKPYACTKHTHGTLATTMKLPTTARKNGKILQNGISGMLLPASTALLATGRRALADRLASGTGDTSTASSVVHPPTNTSTILKCVNSYSATYSSPFTHSTPAPSDIVTRAVVLQTAKILLLHYQNIQLGDMGYITHLFSDVLLDKGNGLLAVAAI